MPVARAPTPPPEAKQQQLSVMDSLNAWTTEEDHEKDDPEKWKPPLRLLGYTLPPVPSDEEIKKEFPQLDQKSYKMSYERLGWRWYFDSESDHFNFMIGMVIIANAIVIGLETDLGRSHFTISQIGPDYFTTPSYLFDCSLVLSGSLDLWILPAMTGGGSEKANSPGYQFSVLRLLRILRLLRVLRVIRLLRMFGQLLLMVKAFGKSIQVVLLLSILVFIMIYALSIVCTQLVGHRSEKWGDDADDIKLWFGTIPTSMATLFWVMFGSGWVELLHLLTKVYHVFFVLVIFGFFMVITVALLALIIGLITESLIIAQGDFKQRAMEKFLVEKKKLASDYTAELKELLEDGLDEDGNVDSESLKAEVKSDSTIIGKLFTAGVQMHMDGLMGLVDSMSQNGKVNVNIDHFVEKLINLSGVSSASSVVDLKYDLIWNRRLMEKTGVAVEEAKKDITVQKKTMDMMLQKMDAVLQKLG